jgi:hypothetical protein
VGESTDIQNSSILLAYVRYIVRDESDMKKGVSRVSELHTRTTSSEVFNVLNVSLKREVSNGKFVLELVLTACLTRRNSGLVTKIKAMAGNNLLSMHCYIHRQNLPSK